MPRLRVEVPGRKGTYAGLGRGVHLPQTSGVNALRGAAVDVRASRRGGRDRSRPRNSGPKAPARESHSISAPALAQRRRGRHVTGSAHAAGGL